MPSFRLKTLLSGPDVAEINARNSECLMDNKQTPKPENRIYSFCVAGAFILWILVSRIPAVDLYVSSKPFALAATLNIAAIAVIALIAVAAIKVVRGTRR